MGLYWNKGRCCLRDFHPRASGRCFCCVLHTVKCFLSRIRCLFLQRNKESVSQSEKFSPSVMTLASDTSNMLKSSKAARVSSEAPCAISRSRSDTCYCISSTMVADQMPRRGSDWTASVRRTVTEHSDIHKILKPLQFIHSDGQSEEKTSLLNRRYSGLCSKITPFSICSVSTTTATTKATREVNRSQSMKSRKSNDARYRNRGSSIPSDANQTCTGTKVKQRTVSNRSLPLPGDESEYLRLRNFSVTSKGIINRGDSFRSKTSPIVVKTQSNPEPEENKSETPDVHRPATDTFRVLLIGATDVGKTALKNQFSTSEYISAYDSVHDDEQDTTVTIVLNCEESEISFEERTIQEGNACIQSSCPDPDAYVLVYSVANRRSYLQARNILSQLETKFDSRAVILVANKTDLARLRAVTTEEGKSLAKERGCKFIETSAAINHQVDELLVGLLTQIRMKKAKMADKQRKKRESTRRSSNCPGSKASGVLKKILRRACLKSKSCDNLHVL